MRTRQRDDNLVIIPVESSKARAKQSRSCWSATDRDLRDEHWSSAVGALNSGTVGPLDASFRPTREWNS